ncbi:MAG TPA: cobalamin B12-binding domain-containing protein, partial [Fimbriimonadaceae bacterium]|nr:cobalamin B12-binding domain-containing protein [Fimbriimonadaceae bacterium]
ITERMMARAMSAFCPGRTAGKLALVACAPGEWHSLGSRMVSDFLISMGWYCRYLGANTPDEALLSAVTKEKPDVVLLSSSVTRDSVLGVVRSIRQLDPYVPIGVGGADVHRFEEELRSAGATFLASSLSALREHLSSTTEKDRLAAVPQS